jgi:hypothetical protein
MHVFIGYAVILWYFINEQKLLWLINKGSRNEIFKIKNKNNILLIYFALPLYASRMHNAK